MPGFGDLVQKAFYLGVGAASLAAEKAGTTLADLKVQAQKLADEMVARGEITAEDAKRMVDEMVSRAQQPSVSSEPASPGEPRRIEILVEDDPADSTASPDHASRSSSADPTVDQLREQVANLQEELRRLKRD